MEKVKVVPKVKLNTSLNSKWGCAIGMVPVQGKKPAGPDSYLFNNYKIHTVSIEWENIKGLRVTTNIYTTAKKLDVLIEGISNFARQS